MIIEVHTEEFRAHLSRWQAGIHAMVRTLSTFAKLVDANAKEMELVPYMSGDLESSFTYLVADGSHSMQVAMTYSSVAEDGYDYALAQHENYYYHPIQGEPFYLETAVFDTFYGEGGVLLEGDFLSLFEL